jgi:chemotaxis signal transduction protein
VSKADRGRDWDEIRERLRRIAESHGRESSLAALFDQRAATLALEGRGEPENGARGTFDYLIFELKATVPKAQATRYGVAMASLKAVESLQTLSAVPGSHPAIVGVTAQRNQVLAVIDLNLVSRPEEDAPARPRLIWLCHKGVDFALSADAVVGIESVPEEASLRFSITGGEVFCGLLDLHPVSQDTMVSFIDLSALLRLLGVDLG